MKNRELNYIDGIYFLLQQDFKEFGYCGIITSVKSFNPSHLKIEVPYQYQISKELRFYGFMYHKRDYKKVLNYLNKLDLYALAFLGNEQQYDEFLKFNKNTKIKLKKYDFRKIKKRLYLEKAIGFYLNAPVLFFLIRPYNLYSMYSDPKKIFFKKLQNYDFFKRIYFIFDMSSEIDYLLGKLIEFSLKVKNHKINFKTDNKSYLGEVKYRPIDTLDALVMLSFWREKHNAKNFEELILSINMKKYLEIMFQQFLETIKWISLKTNPKLKVIINYAYNDDKTIKLFNFDLKKQSFYINNNTLWLLKRFKKGAKIIDVFRTLKKKYVINYEEFLSQISELLKNGILTYMKKEGEFEIIKINTKWPIELAMYEVTKRCNLKCIHCYNYSHPVVKEHVFTSEQFEKSIIRLKKLGLVEVYFTGGEPLFRKDFKELVRICEKHNVWYHIFTNGILINEHWIEFFKEHPPRSFIISLDSVYENEFRAIRGVSNERLMKNITILKKISFVRLNKIVFSKINDSFQSLKQFFEWTSKNNINFIAIEPVAQVGRGNNLKSPPIVKLIQSIDKAYYLAYGRYYYDNISKKNSYCNVAINRIYVRNDGKITLCPLLNDDHHVIGHIDMNLDELKKMFETHPILMTIRNKTYLNEKCKKCKLLEYCYQGCIGKSYEMYGDYTHNDDYFCEVIKYARRNNRLKINKPKLNELNKIEIIK